MPGLDPFKLSEIIERQVTKIRDGATERKYYRFRGGKWYGGIATGDVVGCNLRCKFCWSWRYSFYTDKGWYESPQSSFEKLESIARRHRYNYLRLSGGEPTIGINHLIDLLRLVEDSKHIFIVESNGLLLGKHKDYVKKIAEFDRIVVRISFKGCNENEFESLSGADRSYYQYQFRALEHLHDAGLKPCEEFYPAVMLSFSTNESYLNFRRRLSSIHPVLSECIDEEYVILYPHVKKLLGINGLKPRVAYEPDSIPSTMI